MKVEDKIKALELQRADLDSQIEVLKAEATAVWTSCDGKRRVISEMPTPYLRNAAAAMIRNDAKYPHTVTRMRQFAAVVRELERRGEDL